MTTTSPDSTRRRPHHATATTIPWRERPATTPCLTARRRRRRMCGKTKTTPDLPHLDKADQTTPHTRPPCTTTPINFDILTSHDADAPTLTHATSRRTTNATPASARRSTSTTTPTPATTTARRRRRSHWQTQTIAGAQSAPLPHAGPLRYQGTQSPSATARVDPLPTRMTTTTPRGGARHKWRGKVF